MTISFTDRRCTVDIHHTAKDFSFVYGGKKHIRRNEEAVHNFFLKEYAANKLDTVKLRFSDTSYYLHFTHDEPEKCTKRQLRAILAQECDEAWCEEKNGKQRFFVREGYFFSKIKELTQEEYAAYRHASTIQKAMKFALGALSLLPTLPSHVPQATGIGALFFSVLNAGSALAQMPAIGEFLINTNTSNGQGMPTVAALNDGGFVVAWQGSQTGDNDIYGQKYDATGAPSVSEFHINTNTTNNQQYPAIAALNNGSFITVWEGSQTGDNNIYGQKFDAAATPVESEFLINTNTTNSQRYSSVVDLKNGGFVVAWQGSQTGDNDIYGQRYDSAGALVGSEFRINTDTINNQLSPKLAALNDGGFVVVWYGLQTGNYDIYGQKFDAAGAPWGSEFRINTNTTNNQEVPTLAAFSDGGFVVTWQGSQAGNYDIYGQRFDAAATPVESEFLINTNMTNNQIKQDVAALNDGGFVVVWQGEQSGDPDIYGQRYNATGTPMGSEFRINTNMTNNQGPVVVAGLNDGGFVVSWQGFQTGDYDIYRKRYSSTGAPVLNFSLPSPSLTIISSVTTTSSVTSESTNTPTTASLSMSSLQAGSSSLQASQTTTGFTSTTSTIISSASSIGTSQLESSSSSRVGSSQSSTINSLSSSRSPIILSISEITYGTDYSIILNDENVGTFTITGGTDLYDGTQSNTLILKLDPDADLDGQTITLFTLPSGDEGDFQTIELQGVSCLGYDTQIVQSGPGRAYQITFQATTCSTGSKPVANLIPTMLRV